MKLLRETELELGNKATLSLAQSFEDYINVAYPNFLDCYYFRFRDDTDLKTGGVIKAVRVHSKLNEAHFIDIVASLWEFCVIITLHKANNLFEEEIEKQDKMIECIRTYADGQICKDRIVGHSKVSWHFEILNWLTTEDIAMYPDALGGMI